MAEVENLEALWIMLVGATVILAALSKVLFRSLGVHPLVGYLLLGFSLSLAHQHWGLLTEPVRYAFDFLADLGIVALLFRVGLESHPRALLDKLPKASVIWVGNMILAALVGYVASYYLLNLALIPSLILATALTATSVGVSVAVWQETNALGSANGQLLVDVAELDDISGVALMALLFSLVPVLQQGQGDWWSTFGTTGGLFLTKLALFILFCYLFSRYFEHYFIHLTARLEPPAGLMLTVLGLGFVISALAAWLGFSLAIGALFAGLVFSRDPQAVKTEASFNDLYAFFTPFFFIGIGMHIDPDSLVSGLGLGGVLLTAAIIGKLLGAGLPALLVTGSGGAVLLGISMIPRAEITMVIIHQGRQLGEWAVPDAVYAGMVIVTAGTCIVAPLILRPLLHRWPQQEEKTT